VQGAGADREEGWGGGGTREQTNLSRTVELQHLHKFVDHGDIQSPGEPQVRKRNVRGLELRRLKGIFGTRGSKNVVVINI
jgi:hypothetical protein